MTTGLSVYVPEIQIFQSLCSSFGASGVPMTVGELYTALQTGVVDGAENAPIFYYQQKHHEAAPYLAMTEHIITPDIVVMSKSYLESMPQEYQDAILQAAREMMIYERELWFEQEEQAIKDLIASGVEITEVSKDEFKEAAQTVWKEYVDIIDQDKIDAIQSLVN